MDGKLGVATSNGHMVFCVMCAWIRPFLERMDLREVLCETIFRNAYMDKNERVAGYKQNLVPFIRLFEFGNETELIRNGKNDKTRVRIPCEMSILRNKIEKSSH